MDRQVVSPKELTNYEFLDAVQKRIDKPQKWCKDQNRSPSGRMCTNGALMAEFPHSTVADRRRFRDILLGDNTWGSVPEFNDHYETTHKVLMAKFEEAKARTRQVH